MKWSFLSAWRRQATSGAAIVPIKRRQPPHRRTWRQLSIDPLETRQLLTVSEPPLAEMAAVSLSPATIVGREIFYNHSAFDGRSVAPNAADDGAIAPDKTALLPGQTASFANYTSYSLGINGLMIDIVGLRGTPTLDDFVFRIGNDNAPDHWNPAPAPTSITVRPGAGANGSDRVTIIWPDATIADTWLEVGVLPTYVTGLANADVFYFGNAVGESGDSTVNAWVTTADQLGPRNFPATQANPASITSRWDYNRDRLINSTDVSLARNHATAPVTALSLIRPIVTTLPTVVRARNVFYNDSFFDGYDPAANAADDLAIAIDKSALLPGQAATYANYTSYESGLNGLMIDIAGLTQTLSIDDFELRVGNNNAPSAWTAAPLPSQIAQRAGAGVDGSTRVTLTWPEGAIVGKWLQVTVKANARTGLVAADRFYFGNAVGESGNSFQSAVVNGIDQARASTLISSSAAVTAACDFNRDGVIDAADVQLAQSNATGPANALVLLNFSPPSTDSSTAGPPAFIDFVDATVVGRYIFYNNSLWDGDSPAANTADDLAIAPDKQALLAGQTSSFANYTSYSRGLNGIMIDITGLPQNLTPNDFIFRVGKSGDPASWAIAPALQSIAVRYGAGAGGSDRITITWPDNWIQNTWLQVTVKATPRTGLTKDDVFYFGNVIGESGNAAADMLVNGIDQMKTRQQAAASVDMTAPCDFNRDGQIDSTDELIARMAPTGGAVMPLVAPPSTAVAALMGMQPALFNPGDGGYHLVFGPDLVRTTQGTILAFAEARSGDVDTTAYALVLRRSTDGGASWSPISSIFAVPPESGTIVHHPSAVVDESTGTIFVLFTINNSLVYVTSSDDDGATWSTARDITAGVKVTAAGNPNPAAFPNEPWDWYAVGPTDGIQLKVGDHAGRLVIAADHRLVGDTEGVSWSHILYSDDHGATWHLGGGPDQTQQVNNDSNEAAVIELPNGSLYMSIRMNTNEPTRGASISYDGGDTWSNVNYVPGLTSARVSGSLVRLNASTILYAGPDTLESPNRHQMTIWVSYDNAQTWVKSKVAFYGYAGYSDMVLVGNDTVLLAFNGGQANGGSMSTLSLVRFNLRWLLSTAPPQFSWYFNEQAPGATANTAGPTLRDSSDWDNRAWAQAATSAEAPRYVEGAHAGDAALRLTSGSDSVLLAPSATDSLQFRAADSFTAEVMLRTTDANGVIIGSLPNGPNWSLQLVNGQLQLKLADLATSVVLTSTRTINDGAWHQVVAVRNADVHRIALFVDGLLAGTADDPTQSLRNSSAVYLGAMSDGSGQLAMDVDAVRVTRGALSKAQFLPANFVAPPPLPGPTYPSDAPTSIAGLRLWLPAFDPTHYFADMDYSAPLAAEPVQGTAVRSGYDASSSHYRVVVASDSRQLLYDRDSVVGAHWRDTAASSWGGNQWLVQDSNGTSASNFDFVQNTGVFTLSTFIKPGTDLGAGYMALFDTSQSTSDNPGFSFTLTNEGAIRMQISDNAGNTRILASTAKGLVGANSWYHVAVVGHGVGNPLTFYVTAVSQATVQAYTSNAVISGSNGTYATDAGHDLSIGAQAHTGLAAYNGQIVDQAVFDRALSAAEIQQLFDFTKKI